ncbi:hypothetical protein CANTEDRAFT_114304 [Yamadazyma tenuis ATCC 10573]|uniref:ENTH domain-containing protein n=1 Tax=Candida tenuis (strain ATCC 10573 / BCRC 21748 / CBS 615 / JCM 9827 / NBRC 10315 / NRRL Y-1498 / VKM Y-70) TaxID=590646 RepID=G3B6Q5_CANTC|nr:uncharacterized protein CANTEDRAFT_114304 [Yamadazyma tenuis ATCC 10573]EGV62989.1 hypothetical protein CANTEDRAFT_114304 [Yamadazyma tenuis ATCC 10573]
MGLLGKVQRAKVITKSMVTGFTSNNLFKRSVMFVIEDGKSEPDPQRTQELISYTYNDQGLFGVCECLQEYLDYRGSDWSRVYKAIIVFEQIAIRGSENALMFTENIDTKFKELEAYSGAGKDSINAAAKRLYDFLQDEDLIAETRKNVQPSGVVFTGGQIYQV